jgi:hypothetical protein
MGYTYVLDLTARTLLQDSELILTQTLGLEVLEERQASERGVATQVVWKVKHNFALAPGENVSSVKNCRGKIY